MKGRMRPYLPELTIRDYNTYQWYQRGVRRQLYTTYGLYSCYGLRYNGVLFAVLADSLAGRPATCKRMREPGTLVWRQMMCQTQGIRLAAQVEVLLSWHRIQDAQWADLPFYKKVRRVVDTVLLRRAYRKAAAENPALERIFVQERDQANVQMTLNAKNYLLAAEPKGNLYGALYSVLATDDPNQRKSMHYIGSCIGRAAYLLDKAESFSRDKDKGRYNVFLRQRHQRQERRPGKRPAAGPRCGQRSRPRLRDAGRQAQPHPAGQHHDLGPPSRHRAAGR